MTISPIGSLIIKMDTAMTGSIGALIAAMAQSCQMPLAAAVVVFYGLQGIRMANGDPEPLHNFVPQLVRVFTVMWMATNLTALNYWVQGIFFTGLPNFLATAIGNANGQTPNSLNATAALFDLLWNQIWEVVGLNFSATGLSVTGIIAGLAGFATGLICGISLAVMAIVYVSARMVLAAIICISPILIGCALFDYTRQFFDRAVGAVVSLIILQTIGLVILEILLLGDQWLMAQATTAVLNVIGTGAAVFAEALESLAALTVWFVAGAIAMKNLPAIAYSIGGGVPMRGPSLLGLALLARGAGDGGGGGNGGSLNISSGGNYGLSMNVPQLGGGGGGGQAALSGRGPAALPPPPLAITHSTRS